MRLPRLPDLLTTANLACGVASILLASQGQLTWACGLVFIAAVFDVFDGLAARAMGGGTPLGAQLDSLADMVSFGVAPAFIAFSLFDWNSVVSISDLLIAKDWPMSSTSAEPLNHKGHLLRYVVPILVVIPSAWRLAKFNLDTRQSSGFLGLPTPANGLFWASIPLAIGTSLVQEGPMADLLQLGLLNFARPVVAFSVALILGILMLSELPLPGLKFKHFRWLGNQVIYVMAGLGAVLVVLYGILAVPLILVLYVLSPLWGRVFPKAAS